MDTKKVILDLMNACGEECRLKILDGKYDDVSVVMNYLEGITLSNSWDQAGKIVNEIWYEHNPKTMNPEDEQPTRMKVCPVCEGEPLQDEPCYECGGSGEVEETPEDVENRKWDAGEARWEAEHDK